VRRYARKTSTRSAGLARLLGGAAFALARMAPRRYERLADAGAATGVIDPLLVRAYLRAGKALPAHEARATARRTAARRCTCSRPASRTAS
jgi:DNA polymerase I